LLSAHMRPLTLAVALCLLLLALSVVDAKKAAKKKSPSPQTVAERNLITPAPSYKSILKNHKRYCINIQRQFTQGDTLGFVTPWNPKGLRIANLFAKKFSHLAPVWYQVKPNRETKGSLGLTLFGNESVDAEWVSAIRAASPATKIVPRVILEMSDKEYSKLFGSDVEPQRLINLLTEEVAKQGFEGFVLEMNDAWIKIQEIKPKLRVRVNKFVANFSKALHAMQPPRELILVVPPNSGPTLFNHHDFLSLHAHVDKFSLMTYDFSSNQQKAGPNAPLQWMEAAIRVLVGEEMIGITDVPKKVLLGLNLFGYDFSRTSGRPIFGKEYIKILKGTKPPLQWDPQSHEHGFQYQAFDPSGSKDDHVVWYPSLQSIQDRIDLARRFGCGLSVWELGQGLDYFYDLL